MSNIDTAITDTVAPDESQVVSTQTHIHRHINKSGPRFTINGRDIIVFTITLAVCTSLVLNQVAVLLVDKTVITDVFVDAINENGQVYATIMGALIGIIAAYVGSRSPGASVRQSVETPPKTSMPDKDSPRAG